VEGGLWDGLAFAPNGLESGIIVSSCGAVVRSRRSSALDPTRTRA